MQKFFRVSAFFLFVALIVPQTHAKETPKLPLYGTVVIIDPGHGGMDPGSYGVSQNGAKVYEAPYVYDVAKRLAQEVKTRGGISLMTRRDPKSLLPDNALVLDFEKNGDVYTANGKMVRALMVGMLPRMEVARNAVVRYPRHHVVFMSIHFDSENDPMMQGVHVIAPKGGSRIASLVVEEFRKSGRTRKKGTEEFFPLIISGDESHGVRDLYVLRAENNPVKERVLVELGNFGNRDDVWRIRDPAMRQNFAQILAQALVAWQKK